MKKILFAFVLVAGFTIAANAQSNNKSQAADPAKVEAASKTTTTGSSNETAVSKSESGSQNKSCCSSRNGKESSKKSCCTDGKKASANCHETIKEDKVKVAE